MSHPPLVSVQTGEGAQNSIVSCEAQCGAEYVHPAADECPTLHGGCALLMGAGWRPVYMRIFPEGTLRWTEQQMLFSRGGWICGACVKKYFIGGREKFLPENRSKRTW